MLRAPRDCTQKEKGHTTQKYYVFVGGINVADIPAKKGEGMCPVSMEQVIVWDPEVILVKEPQFYEKVFTDECWQDIIAVKNQYVYLTPQYPFSWFDRPPGVNQIIGIPWLADKLYPEKTDINMTEETKIFFSKFYHYELSDEKANQIMSQESTICTES